MTTEAYTPYTVERGLFGRTKTTFFEGTPTAPIYLQPKKKAATKEKQPKTKKSKEFKMSAGKAAFIAVVLYEAVINTGQVQADEDHCTDAGHQQIVTESGTRSSLRDFQSTVFSKVGIGNGPKDQTTSAVSNQLTASRGYSVSEAQLIDKNKDNGALQHDERGQLQNQFAAGVHCIDVPGPVYAGFERVDDSESLHQIAVANLLSTTALKELNPSFKNYENDKPLNDGTVLKVDKKPNKDFVYREVSSKEKDINTMSDGKEKKRTELLQMNAAAIGSGGAVSKGEEAFIWAKETGWMKKHKMGLDDIKKVFTTTEITTMKKSEIVGESVKGASAKKKTPEKAEKTLEAVENEKYNNISHEVSVKATDNLAARGKDWENRAKILRHLLDNTELLDYQAATLDGGFVVETGHKSLPSDQLQYHGPAKGLAQWEWPRFKQLLAYAKKMHTSWKNFTTQKKFIVHELKTTERHAYVLLQQSETIVDANYVAAKKYERAGSPDYARRLHESNEIVFNFRKEVDNVLKAEKS